MTCADMTMPELEHEVATVRRVHERLPEDQLD
jgi:hypothetical protein